MTVHSPMYIPGGGLARAQAPRAADHWLAVDPIVFTSHARRRCRERMSAAPEDIHDAIRQGPQLGRRMLRSMGLVQAPGRAGRAKTRCRNRYILVGLGIAVCLRRQHTIVVVTILPVTEDALYRILVWQMTRVPLVEVTCG